VKGAQIKRFAEYRNCVPLVNILGVIFQICDDYLNLSSTTYSKNKGLCEDLTEGKFSFPIIHSIRSDPKNLQLINILKQKTRDVEVKLYAVNYIKSTGSFAYTRKVVAQLHEKALQLIDDVDRKWEGEKRNVRENDNGTVKGILKKMVELTLRDDKGSKEG
jgi:geranylgeranyl diphosphate synthase, type III